MRLSELIGANVHDTDGNAVGAVTDVRLVRDGPLLGTFGAAYHVAGLIVTPGRRGSFFGYERAHLNRPWLLNWLLAYVHKGTVWARWDMVDNVTTDGIRLKVRRDELHEPPPID